MEFQGIFHEISWNYEVAKVSYYWEFQATDCQIYFAIFNSNLATFIAKQFICIYRLCSYFSIQNPYSDLINMYCGFSLFGITKCYPRKIRDIYRGHIYMPSPERKMRSFLYWNFNNYILSDSIDNYSKLVQLISCHWINHTAEQTPATAWTKFDPHLCPYRASLCQD